MKYNWRYNQAIQDIFWIIKLAMYVLTQLKYFNDKDVHVSAWLFTNKYNRG